MQCRTTDRRPALSDLTPAGLRFILFWISRGGTPEMCGVFVTTTTTTPLPCTTGRVVFLFKYRYIPLHKPHSFPWLCIAKRIKVSHGYSGLVETHQYSRLTNKNTIVFLIDIVPRNEIGWLQLSEHHQDFTMVKQKQHKDSNKKLPRLDWYDIISYYTVLTR